MAIMTEAMEATARSYVYAFLAQAFVDPDAATLARLKLKLATTESALSAIGGTESRGAFAVVRDEIDALDVDALAAAHRRVFGLGVSGDCPPYEGEYGHSHIFQKTQSLADNAGFFQAFGLVPAPGLTDRLDHISIELEFLHILAAKEAYALIHGHGEERLAVVRDAKRGYFERHLGRWAPAFAAALQSKVQEGPYAALARLLAAFVAEEALTLDVGPVPMAAGPIDAQSDDEPAICEQCTAAAVHPIMRGNP